MVKLVLLVVMLLSVTIQGANLNLSNNENSPIDQLKSFLNRTNGYVSVLTELLVNLNKVWQHFMKELGTDNAPSAIIESSLLAVATTNENKTCLYTEDQNFGTLVDNVTDAVEQCVMNFTSESATTVNDFYNTFKNATQLITNATTNITTCVETTNSSILMLPKCIWQQLQYIINDSSVVVNEVNTILPNVIMIIGKFAKTVRSCITSIGYNFLTSVYDILIDFVNCM